jgi:arylsulfatase A-like enzyme
MRRRRNAFLAPLVLAAALPLSCRRAAPMGPQHLLEMRTLDGRLPRQGALASGTETRPALLEPARFRVRLPRRALLTFGMGLAWTGAGDAPGWYELSVRAGDRVLAERKLNPRVARGFRDVSLPLDGLGSETTLSFDLRLAARDGRPLPVPKDLLIGVADPVVHDLDAYGRAKGILLVSIDTLRRDHVGIYGYPKPTTPRLDALARQGLLLDDAVSTSSWTLPAHLSMFTSVDPGIHGGTDPKHGFNHKVPTVAALLRSAGYATQAVTSHLYVSPVYGADDGFDHMDFEQDRKATDVANRAMNLLDRFGDRRFFVFLHFYDPHWHYDPPEKERRLFPDDYRGPLTGNLRDFEYKTKANTTPAELRHLLALYDGEIRYTDDEIGRILDHLKGLGLDRSTLVFVTSDHGEEFLDHGSWEHQKTLYEEVVRVPMLLRGPGVAVRREGGQVSLLDVAPTLLAWAGVAAPPSFEGRDLLRPLDPREAYGETDNTLDHTHKLFLRAGASRWKAIFSLAKDGGSLKREEWYDLATDPGERREAPPRAAVAEPIRRRALERWRGDRARGAGAPAVDLTPEQRERLRALGYVGS